MAVKFARCVNIDYCSAGDRRLVMRLDEHEAMFCPECAHALIAAPAWDTRRISWPVLGALVMAGAACGSAYMLAQRWPHAVSEFVAEKWQLVAGPAAPAPPSLLDEIAGIEPARLMPQPAKFFMAVALDAVSLRKAANFVLLERRIRPPHMDPLVRRARADLEAAVPFVPWPRDDGPASAMPWRQALILAALMNGRATPPDALPPPIVAPPDPLPASPPLAAEPTIPPEPHFGRQTIRPQFIRPQSALVPKAPIGAPTQAMAQSQAAPPARPADFGTRLAQVPPKAQGAPTPNARPVELSLSDSVMPTHAALQADLISLIMPMPDHAARHFPPFTAPGPAAAPAKPPPAPPREASASAASEIPPILRAPKAPPPINDTPRLAAPPVRLAKAPARPSPARPTTRVAAARKPAVPAYVATKLPASGPKATPKQLALAQPAAPLPADPPPEAPPAPQNHVVVVPSGFSMSYTPLRDVNLSSIVMPPRPTSNRPQMGSLKVDCAVETSGLPSDCHVLHAEHASAVSGTLLAWLSSGLVHRAPSTQNGHPVRARQTWTLEFPAQAQRQAGTVELDTQ